MKTSMLTSLTIVAVLVFLTVTQPSGPVVATHRYVRVIPNQPRECRTSEQCFTFSECLQRPQEVFKSNTTVQFSAEEYRIANHSYSSVSVTADNLLITGPDSSSDEVHIVCHSRFRFQFFNNTNLTLTNFVFTGCGSESSLYSGALLFHSVTTLNLTSVVIQDSYGYGLMGIGIGGKITISNCSFCNNSWRGAVSNKMGGNCLLYIMKNSSYSVPPNTEISIFNSNFSNSSAERVLQYEGSSSVNKYSGGGGLAIYYAYYTPRGFLRRTFNVTIQNCRFFNNSARHGGNIMMHINNKVFNYDYLYASFVTVSINISLTNCTIQEGKAQKGGGGIHLQFYAIPTLIGEKEWLTFAYIEVSESNFIANKAENGGAISLVIAKVIRVFDTDLLFSKVLMTQNEAYKGGAIYAENIGWNQSMYIQYSQIMHNYAEIGGGLYLFLNHWGDEYVDPISFGNLNNTVVIHSTNFTRNTGEVIGSAIAADGHFGVETCGISAPSSIVLVDVEIKGNSMIRNIYATAAVHINSVRRLTVKNTLFSNNTGGIYANNSDILIVGDVRFERNSGYYGGAIQLACICNSYDLQPFIYFSRLSHMSVMNNRVLEYGGGIGVSEVCSNPDMCFYQLSNWNTTWTQDEYPYVEMRDNQADISGDSIYGVSNIPCNLFVNSKRDVQELSNQTLFNSLFRASNWTLSSIASIPYRICFCKHNSPKHYCMDTMSKTVFPGQEFTVIAAAVGNHRGASPATVQAQFHLYQTQQTALGTRQDVQKLGRECDVLTYSVKTTSPSVQLHLKVEGSQKTITSDALSAIVNISIIPCPLGFTMVNEPPECDCMHHLAKVGIVCDINTQTHYCPTGMWIGNFAGEITTHPNCPFDYCKPGRNVSLTSQQEQCQYNRSGVLCGSCQTDLSLTLGTSQCKKCSNSYSLLFFVFLTAGVVLVFLLLKCNLTVSTGTINGLIFYANVVRANQATFFPHEKTGSAVSFLSAFIAWLNLDVGIEVCFFNGLTAYSRAWLQFLFPAYIWILVGLIIASSRYSTRMAKLTGNNSVPVLATLFLLSYAKLLRTIIDVASFTTLTDASSDTTAVWLIDGNLEFLSAPHIFLFIVALVAVFLYILPFTILVLLAPFLQAKSNLRLLRWIHKIKPLLDAFQGPYKDRFRFWTGLLLVVRGILFITFASNVLGDARVNLLAIAITLFVLLLVLWNTGCVYRSLLPHIIECFYVLNLAVYTVATLFLTSSNALSVRQEQLAGVMVGTAFMVFCSVLAYHIYGQARNIEGIRSLSSAILTSKWLRHCVKKNSAATDGETEMDCVDVVNGSDHEGNESEMHAMCAAPSIPLPTVSVVDIPALREPLLTIH